MFVALKESVPVKQESKQTLRIAFVGAGQVNFGGGEGPWDHATRIEMLHVNSLESPVLNGAAMIVVGIADPDVERCKKVLELRRDSKSCFPALDSRHRVTHNVMDNVWKDTQCFADPILMLDTTKPDLVFIGIPPEKHGSCKAPNNLVQECAKRKIHMFVEKPISCHPLEDVESLSSEVHQYSSSDNLIVSVGYMFRYSHSSNERAHF